MAKNNPYAWVSPAVAAANGFNTDGTPAARRKPAAQGAGVASAAVPAAILKPPRSLPYYMGQAARGAVNAGIGAANDTLRGATDVANAYTYPLRAGGAALADFRHGVLNEASTPTPVPAGMHALQLPTLNTGAPTDPAADPQGAAPVAGAPAAAGGGPATKSVLWNPSVAQMRGAGAIAADPLADSNFDAAGNVVPIAQMRARQVASGLVSKTSAPSGQIPVAPVDRPALETGVTLPDGRKLPYGAMVNGVPTFSDGSGGGQDHVATIPRTMTDAEIKGLGDRLTVVPHATAFLQAPPAFNSPDSEANIEAIMRSKQGGKFGVTPQMNADANLAAVTNQDARTTLGRAAMNASRTAGAATSVLQRKSALDALAGLNATVRANDVAARTGQNALDVSNAQGANALQRTNLAGQYGLADATVRGQSAALSRRPDRFQSADGSLWTMGANGQPAPVLGTDGVQLKGNVTAPAGAAAAANAANANDLKLATQLLGLDPAGQITDAATGKQRAPTPADWQRAMQQARATYAQHGGAAQGAIAAAAPVAGEVRSGYRFKGGDPNNKNNWEQVQ